jgi:RNase P protein component
MKRLIRETFRRNGGCHAGLDIVVTPRRIFPRGSGPSIASELTQLLELAGKKCLVSYAH